MEGESGVTRSTFDELDSWDIQGDQMEGQRGVTRSVNDELHSFDLVKRKVKVVFIEVSMMIFIFQISNQVKWKVREVLPKYH